jgi:hypothetical protein
MRKIILIIISTFINNYGFSQNDSSQTNKIGINFEGVQRYSNISNLNKSLKSAGISEIEYDLKGGSIGLTSRNVNTNNYFTINISWIHSLPYQNTNDSILSNLDIFEFSNKMNWVLTKNSKWLFFPFFGYGVGFTKLKLTEDITFKESISTLSDPAIYYSNMPHFFANIGLGLDRNIRILKDLNFYVGLNLGYVFTTKTSWDYRDAPSDNFGGLEFNVKFRYEFNKNSQ